MLIRGRGNRRRASGGAAPRWWRIDWRVLNWRRLGIGAGMLAVLGSIAWALAALGDRPVGRIEVEGNLQRVNVSELEATVRRQLGTVGFVSIDLRAVQRTLHTLPWVDRVTVERRWPNVLAVRITEQVAVARWGESDLLNARGERFISGARFVPPELPRLYGPYGTEPAVVRRYQELQGRVVGVGMRVVAVELDARGAWTVQLDNGVGVRLGRAQVEERIARFVAAALPLISQRAADIAYVDMRYSNGFAVGWRATNTRVAFFPPANARPADKDLDPDA